jgi:hypothetical protein
MKVYIWSYLCYQLYFVVLLLCFSFQDAFTLQTFNGQRFKDHFIVASNNPPLIFQNATSTSKVDKTTSLSASNSVNEQLSYLQTMAAGAVSRSMAQTLLHPAYTYKTLLQLKDGEIKSLTIERLLRGADAQFIMSLPHGAFYFYVIDQVKRILGPMMSPKLHFIADFASSTISTLICSVVSTPQMVITDRLMAGIYPTFPAALQSIMKTEGVTGFYRGWWPALAQKIPSYG